MLSTTKPKIRVSFSHGQYWFHHGDKLLFTHRPGSRLYFDHRGEVQIVWLKK